MDALPRLRTPDRAATVASLTIDKLVSADDPVRVIWSDVTTLNLDRFVATIRAVEGRPGRNATDPRLLVALWMFATVEGVGSARRLARLCVRDVGFRWLCGGVTVNYHLLSNFRTHAGTELEALFHEHVAIRMHAELVHLKRVAQDGMRVRAHAGAGSFHRLESLEQCPREVAEPLRLLQDQPDQPKGTAACRSRAARERHAREKLERLKVAQQDAAELARAGGAAPTEPTGGGESGRRPGTVRAPGVVHRPRVPSHEDARWRVPAGVQRAGDDHHRREDHRGGRRDQSRNRWWAAGADAGPGRSDLRAEAG
ncbi:hypothetical protein GobsT_41360 [Gemmata obscuriglobus]|nr:transposase [Gemmata obscuriglobus]QEG29340.1 hypothetical protein GobsT_41360 [Gemmata obscuriglobus]VTS08353.1 Transposase, IS4 family protein OS=Plesiocystis pacifica SIR-1 GN=PPSIR1_04413 PE=4 SV=1: DUF772 [Gemmata obscuriglobus UQM 2246]